MVLYSDLHYVRKWTKMQNPYRVHKWPFGPTEKSMKLAYSSNAYTRFSIEETIRRISAIGFTGLELLADVPHAWPAGLLPERVEAIRACLSEHQLQIANVNGFMMNGVADPRQTYWYPSWIEPDENIPAARCVWPQIWGLHQSRPSRVDLCDRANRFPKLWAYSTTS